jgi:hypothetical protein
MSEFDIVISIEDISRSTPRTYVGDLRRSGISEVDIEEVMSKSMSKSMSKGDIGESTSKVNSEEMCRSTFRTSRSRVNG